MEWLPIMFTIYGNYVGEPRWPTMVILRVGLAKKDKKCHQKQFSTPAGAKNVKFRRAAASYKR